jgi:hypothetical protein
MFSIFFFIDLHVYNCTLLLYHYYWGMYIYIKRAVQRCPVYISKKGLLDI